MSKGSKRRPNALTALIPDYVPNQKKLIVGLSDSVFSNNITQYGHNFKKG